jgi:hypothetical protein
MKTISTPHPPSKKGHFCCKICGSSNMKTNRGFIIADDHDCLDCGAWNDDIGFWCKRVDGKLSRVYFVDDGEYGGFNL